MSDAAADPAPKKGVDLGALAHAIAGVCALVLGGLMYSRPWARELFALLMIVAAASAVYFSWKHSAWVTGHWLAMVPVFGVMLGYIGWQWGFHPCLRYALDRVYPFCHSGDTVKRAQLGQGPTVDGRLPLLR